MTRTSPDGGGIPKNSDAGEWSGAPTTLCTETDSRCVEDLNVGAKIIKQHKLKSLWS